jgi:hypothetical protein
LDHHAGVCTLQPVPQRARGAGGDHLPWSLVTQVTSTHCTGVHHGVSSWAQATC